MVAGPTLPPLAAIAPAAAIELFGALAMFFAAFALVHDVAHGSLGLSKRTNEFVLAIGGATIATTGHGLRVAHLRHHAHPLAADDLEGASAKMPFWRAALLAPILAIVLHVSGWRHAPRRERRKQLAEYLALAALIVGGSLGPRALRIYMMVAVVMQLLAPLWAGHIPHRTPRWLMGLVHCLAFTGSPTVMSLLHHDLHHELPKVPIGELPAVAELRAKVVGSTRDHWFSSEPIWWPALDGQAHAMPWPSPRALRPR